MLRYCYILLSYLVQPFILLLILKKSLKQPAYRQRLCERYGHYDNKLKPKAKGIIIHAASVGEVIAATPLIKQLQQTYPTLPITVTTVTPTGSDRVKAAFGESVSHFYLPYDLPYAVKRFIDFIDPKLIVVIETELWPTLIHQFHQRRIPFVIANARLSPRSTKRYTLIKQSIKEMLSEVDMILAQDDVSAERYLQLGYDPLKMDTTGNLKFDLNISSALRNKISNTLTQLAIQNRPIWIAGSTHEGEEKLILEAHKKLLEKYPNLVLIIVPRHPERFLSVEELIKKSGLNYVKRSSNEPFLPSTQLLLGDSMGEMMILYGLSKIAFVGGSLVKHGGHNPLEPIAFELPVISGVHTYNFPEIFSKLREVNGVIEIDSSVEALVESVEFLLQHEDEGKKIAQFGFEVLKENQGALKHHLALLAPYLEKKYES
ncbi:lipid IV(A) 3-deoxy-D-manno-octulosonic acid transferase [Actinobacillus minor]|uniref:lipid IV(A) 3-deoxy-D-manno-octulosonic acid transferase n=1 Tax=Actinobacillus minor TaxID=51047 RepID=UPI0023F2384F|nr:lipid IV(A) 3-deoxy-D-manno-octulosonic acid transferase [Actinobacillus minor]MDD6910808.1 lipid IV(A) 3-deoxy-D-manno-octulosonic acid transferase [Actinobacillus minor]MDY4713603.1 lipid IV(A) 3-deoxy-D-manno-octulosonic acid transferase [Actinobacillus minor]